MVGKARMDLKVGLTFACMNLKKLAKILSKYDSFSSFYPICLHFLGKYRKSFLLLEKITKAVPSLATCHRFVFGLEAPKRVLFLPAVGYLQKLLSCYFLGGNIRQPCSRRNSMRSRRYVSSHFSSLQKQGMQRNSFACLSLNLR